MSTTEIMITNCYILPPAERVIPGAVYGRKTLDHRSSVFGSLSLNIGTNVIDEGNLLLYPAIREIYGTMCDIRLRITGHLTLFAEAILEIHYQDGFILLYDLGNDVPLEQRYLGCWNGKSVIRRLTRYLNAFDRFVDLYGWRIPERA